MPPVDGDPPPTVQGEYMDIRGSKNTVPLRDSVTTAHKPMDLWLEVTLLVWSQIHQLKNLIGLGLEMSPGT